MNLLRHVVRSVRRRGLCDRRGLTMRWLFVALLAWEGALFAGAPAPAPRRPPLPSAQASETARDRLVEAVWQGRDERVTFRVAHGEAWRCPRLRRREGVESKGLSLDAGTSG